MTNSGHTSVVEIIIPDGFHVVSSDALRICEVFIARLLSCALAEIAIEVDVTNRYVSCTESGIKQLLQMVVGAGEWSTFIEQLLEYLREPIPRQNGGVLSLVTQDRRHNYMVTLNEKPPSLFRIRIQEVLAP